jgi:hypothetical protein
VPKTTATAVNQNLASEGVGAAEDLEYLVTLRNPIDDMTVVFYVLPDITENRSVEYEPIAPAQFPGAFQKYKGTPAVTWQMTAKFISRTTDEATMNLRNLNLLRTWTMPYFGQNTARDGFFKDRLGGPPPVLQFKGLRKGMIGPVPVVITSVNWSFPQAVDYIPAFALDATGATPANVPFPAVMDVTVNLTESFSTEQFNQFDIGSYYQGDMVGAYNKKLPEPTPAAPVAETQQEAQEVMGKTSAAADIAKRARPTVDGKTSAIAELGKRGKLPNTSELKVVDPTFRPTRGGA